MSKNEDKNLRIKRHILIFILKLILWISLILFLSAAGFMGGLNMIGAGNNVGFLVSFASLVLGLYFIYRKLISKYYILLSPDGIEIRSGLSVQFITWSQVLEIKEIRRPGLEGKRFIYGIIDKDDISSLFDIILWGNPQTKYNSDIFVIFQKNAETNSDFVKCPSGCGTEEGILVTLDNWMKKYK